MHIIIICMVICFCRDIIKMVYQTEGVLGFQRGLTATWFRDILGYFIFLSVKTAITKQLDGLRVYGKILFYGCFD